MAAVMDLSMNKRGKGIRNAGIILNDMKKMTKKNTEAPLCIKNCKPSKAKLKKDKIASAKLNLGNLTTEDSKSASWDKKGKPIFAGSGE